MYPEKGHMKYLLRSLLTFLVLYGLVALVADKVYFGHGFSISLGMQIGMAILLFQYLIGPLIIRWVMDIDWNAQLPVRNRQALDRTDGDERSPDRRVRRQRSPRWPDRSGFRHR